MCCVANAQKTGAGPPLQTANLHGQQAHVIPVSQFADTIAQEGLQAGELFTKFFDSPLAKRVRCALWNHQATLPVILAIDHHKHFAGFGAPESLAGITVAMAEPHPQHIHGCAQIDYLKPGALAHRRAPAISAHREKRSNLHYSVGSLCLYSGNPSVILKQVDRFCLHHQLKSWILFGLFDKEIQELPLRHEREEFAVGGKVGEVAYFHRLFADLASQFVLFLMGAFQELLYDAEFPHQFQGRGMNCVAPKIAQKVRVLLQHNNLDAGASQQKAEHHSGGSATNNAALGLDRRIQFADLPAYSQTDGIPTP